mmetsp:Transcript_6820/g.15077  ORF Transcript_6820/g.15077 Transcript_6820/m.15077 type:complete len:1260 (-) Transcript_6820:80-3859(-)
MTMGSYRPRKRNNGGLDPPLLSSLALMDDGSSARCGRDHKYFSEESTRAVVTSKAATMAKDECCRRPVRQANDSRKIRGAGLARYCRKSISQLAGANASANEKRKKRTPRMVSKNIRQKATRKTILGALCFILPLSMERLHVAVEASSSSDGSSARNAPFLVMSEITVQSVDGVDGSNPIGSGSASGNENSPAGGSNSDDAGVNVNQSEGINSGVAKSNRGEQSLSDGGSSSGSDTDGEDDDELNESTKPEESSFAAPAAGDASATSDVSDPTADAANSASQPLRTLKRLQAMLEDSDYATHTVAPASGTVIGSSETNVDELSDVENTIKGTKTNSQTNQGEHQAMPQTQASTVNNSNESLSSQTDKLWTSKDRAKYRRTRRTEKQRQERQQREYEEQHARKIRDIQRQRIIREERERKELVELRRKQAEVINRQRQQQQYEQQNGGQEKQFFHFEETSDFEDDTDTDGMGFELPNLPVYLSDGETDDFSEESDELPKMQQRPPPRPIRQLNNNYSPQNPQQQEYRMPDPSMGQNNNMPQQPYQYAHPGIQQQSQQQQQPPPQQRTNTPYPNSYQQYPPYSQQQQTMPQYQQYGQHNHQQMQEDQRRQYEQHYAAWAQAAANGYYYPPPPHPSTMTFQQQQRAQQQQQQQQQQQPHQSSYPPQQNPYTTQQQQMQQNQGHPYATHAQQQSYYMQQLQQQQQAEAHSSAARGPYSSIIPPRQASSFPRSQASQAASSAYQDRMEQQRSFLGRDDDASKEWSAEQEEQKQDEDILQKSHNEATINTSTDPVPPSTMAESPTEINPNAVTQYNESISNNVTTATSIHDPMAVNSAFVMPPSPLISSMPSSPRVVAPINAEGPYIELDDESAVLIAGTESKISFDSIQKLSFSTIGVSLLSYCAVSPRTLPFPEYNRLFLQNLSIVWLAAIAPLVSLLAVYDGKYNNINTAIGTFHVSFTLGYALAFISEVVVTTVARLGVFRIWEPDIFSLTPEVPSIILPWVLREKQYKPKRITLFAADFAASCVASPIIEEYLKLKVVQWTCKLPRNFKKSKKMLKGKSRRKKQNLQPVRGTDAPQVVNINCYITQMLAASLGLKLFDVTRRILMYTKEKDDYKRIYAVLRGTFPIHELCGTMTALLLARRDVLGVDLPQWKILAPAVFIHAMANFRGKKPIFKWNSSTPWSEMQLNQMKKEGNELIWKQLIPQTYSKLVWLTILARAFGFCIKNYYLVGRQAMKRTTTYSGKLHAFNAKLQTDAMLKRS